MTSSSDNPPRVAAGSNRRSWLLLLVLALVVAGTALGVRGLTAPMPDGKPVQAAVRVLAPSPGILDEDKGPGAADPDLALFRDQRLQLTLVKSQGVLAAALKAPEVARLAFAERQTDPLAWLGKNLEAAFVENTEYLRMSLGGSDATRQERAVLLNAVLNAYVKEANRQETAQQELLLADVKGLYDKAGFNLVAERQRLRELAQDVGAGPEGLREKTFVQEDLAELRKELRQVQLARIRTQARLNRQKDAPAEESKAAIPKLQEEVALLAEQEKLLQEAIAPLAKKADQLALESIELEHRRAEYAAQERVVHKLLEKKERLQVEAEASKARVIIAQRPEP